MDATIPMVTLTSTTQVYMTCNLVTVVKEVVLESAFKRERENDPTATQQEIIRKVRKQLVPASVQGSSAYHQRALKDLLAVVKRKGIPDFFLTLTQDDCSPLKWVPIKDLEDFLQRFKGGGRYTDLSVECAELFHARCENFLRQCMTQEGGGLLGRVQHYVRRYEVQGRGALHAHILLWVHSDDVERVAQEITASMPCVYAETRPGSWTPQVPHEDDGSIVSLLCQQVKAKQMHTCRQGKHGCRPKEIGKVQEDVPSTAPS